jgi:hypothetical protein
MMTEGNNRPFKICGTESVVVVVGSLCVVVQKGVYRI